MEQRTAGAILGSPACYELPGGHDLHFRYMIRVDAQDTVDRKEELYGISDRGRPGQHGAGGHRAAPADHLLGRGKAHCYGICLPGDHRLVAFARVVSDGATMYYLADMVVDEAWRGRGLGTALVSHIVTCPAYAPLRGLLFTRDAHGLYRKFGFEPASERVMVKAPKG